MMNQECEVMSAGTRKIFRIVTPSEIRLEEARVMRFVYNDDENGIREAAHAQEKFDEYGPLIVGFEAGMMVQMRGRGHLTADVPIKLWDNGWVWALVVTEHYSPETNFEMSEEK